MPTTLEIVRRQLTLKSHRLWSLPILVLSPHSRCNCRCVMCDIWKANQQRREISYEELERHLDSVRRLHVETVVLTGGEALMHSNLWKLCELLRDRGVRITLLSTGLLIARNATDIVKWCDEVIVSLDGDRETHDRIRRVPQAFDQLALGVAELRSEDSSLRITGRCVVQRENFRVLEATLEAAKELGLDRISFLSADTSSEAFNRPEPWSSDRVGEVALSAAEAEELVASIEEIIASHAADFASGWIAESPEKMRDIGRHFQALHGRNPYPETRCNAPWVSAVVEADGTVRPCFFHRPFGNLEDGSLSTILNSKAAIQFRRNLNVKTDPICERCVCTLQLSPRAAVP